MSQPWSDVSRLRQVRQTRVHCDGRALFDDLQKLRCRIALHIQLAPPFNAQALQRSHVVVARIKAVVYVDWDRPTGRWKWHRARGAEVLPLDMDTPFTAARARNAGYRRLLVLHPQIRFVQFVDGDCEVVAEWIEVAHHYLESQPDCAAVCGRRS